MDQELDDRRPSDSDQPTKKQRPNPQRLTLQNPNGVMNGLPANQVNRRMVDFEQQQQQQAVDEQQQQQQAGRKRRRSKKLRRKSRKSRKSRRHRR
jgi:hypothetical protein